MKSYNSDSPVSLEEDDRFSRWAFANRIAQVIEKQNDPACLTIGLYGAWGDGKTSVLNFIETALSHSDRVICIRFNPWRFSSEDELLYGFFNIIANALDVKLIKDGEKLLEIIKKLAPGIGSAAGAQEIGESISAFIHGPDLNVLRKRIEEELESTKKRVLVVIDDVDRLERKEIQAIFKLVKMVADFKYTAYLLAFDKDVVASSLQESYSSNLINAGEAFLEKIIQVPLNLPVIPQDALRHFCFEGVDQALEIAEITLSEQQVQEFIRYFSSTFDDRLRTPRKAKLYGNILLFSLPILKGEVNPVDLMLIEAIRVFCQSLYELIKRNGRYFTGSFSESQYSNTTAEKEEIKGLVELALRKDSIETKDAFIDLLKYLFPKLQAVYGNTFFGTNWHSQWDEGQRICSENYFNRYFSYSIPKNDISDNTINQIIDEFDKESIVVEYDNNPLYRIVTPSNSEVILKKLRKKETKISVSASKKLARALAFQCNTYPNPENLFRWTNPFVQAAILISNLIQNAPRDERTSWANECIEKANSIIFKLEIFSWLKKPDKDHPENDTFSNDEISNIGQRLSCIVKELLDSGCDITMEYNSIVPRLFFILKEYLGCEKVEEYINQMIDSNDGFLLRLVDSFTPRAWGMESGISHKSDFERDQYNTFISVINPDLVVPRIESIISIEELEKEYPREFDSSDRSIILKQFIWIHNDVKTEKINENGELP